MSRNANKNKNRGMKKISQKVMVTAVASTMMLSPVAGMMPGAYTFNTITASAAARSVSILESYGDLENASVEWKAVDGASGYNVYYKLAGASDSQYKQLDNELIRQYKSYFRADAVGLEAGDYVMKIVPIIDGAEASMESSVTSKISVKPHTREGFAFSKESTMGTGSGGYNDDGSVPADATVLYVTSDNINDVTAEVVTSSKGVKTKCTGLVNILAARQKGYDKSHMIIRMVGEIKAADINGLNSNGYLQLKGCYNLTFEGIGEDAVINGWGLLVRNSRNVEIRNLGVMLFPDDGISLDTDNENIWIHNNDIFYGTAGSDKDQAKGDGSCDVKGYSTNVTISYNHFWDTGKSSLCGMNDTEEFTVSYHHNWFDHSDSRHPRIRVGTIHIYNNYFDGNSKYGVGVTKGASAFVEANAFRNCKNPMMSSLQGTDIANGGGTFSGEAGGMIKAYNNSITGAKSLIYAQDNAKQFDAYLASSRNEAVPSSYKTVSGGTTYNNFDTSSKMYSYTPDAPENVVSNVTTFAGRINGGDFVWKFTAADDESYSVNAELMDKIKSYKSDVVAIGGNSIVGVPGEPEVSPEEPEVKPEIPEVTPDVPEVTPEQPSVPETPVQPEVPEVPEVPETPEVPEVPVEPEIPEMPETPEDSEEPEAPEEDLNIVHNFTTDGINSSFYSIKGNLSGTKGTVLYNGLTLTQCLKVESDTSIKFTTKSSAKLTLVFNSSFSKKIVIDGQEYTASKGIVTVDLEAGSHSITKENSANLYYISLN